jgi:hypothetical protein
MTFQSHLNLLAQLRPQQGFCLSRWGAFAQAVRLAFRLKHASSKAPSLHQHYLASSLLWAFPTPAQYHPVVMSSSRLFPLSLCPGGSPRFLDCSFGARRPLSPRRAGWLLFLVSSPSVLASSSSADWPLSPLVSRGRSGFACATAYAFVSRGFANGITPICARLTTCATSNSHDELLSVHENSQSCPGAPKNTKNVLIGLNINKPKTFKWFM